MMMDTQHTSRRLVYMVWALIPAAVFIITLEASGQDLYWAEDYQVLRSDHALSRPTVLITEQDYRLTAFALDVENRKIYWSLLVGGRIKKANLDGSGIEDLGVSNALAEGFLLDPQNQRLYWTERFLRRIRSVRTDGTDLRTVAELNHNPGGLVLDTQAGMLYWDNDLFRDIWRMTLDGRDQQLFHDSHGEITGMGFASGDGILFWSEFGPIIARPVSGTATHVITSSGAHRFGVDEINDNVWWYDKPAQLFHKTSFDGLFTQSIPYLSESGVRWIAVDGRECSGNGIRVDGTCVCDDQWSGDNCACFMGKCAGGCSGHGTCSCGYCYCEPGWQGDDCSCPTECPSGCSGHGSCDCGVCICDDGYTGEDCACFTGPCLNDCSNQGACDCGTCVCDVPWDGPDCSCMFEPCPGDCSGHGECDCGICVCTPGWEGDDCTQASLSPMRVFMAPDGLQNIAATHGHTTYVMPAGERVRMMVWMHDVTPPGDELAGYQLILSMAGVPQGRATGRVEYVDNNPGQPGGDSAVVDTQRDDWVFASHPAVLEPTYNETPAEDFFGVFYATIPGLGIDAGATARVYYLFEFDIESSVDAQGEFELRFFLAPKDTGPLTAMFTHYGSEYVTDEFQKLTVLVGGVQPLTSIPPHTSTDPSSPRSSSGQGGLMQMTLNTNGPATNLDINDLTVAASEGSPPQVTELITTENQATARFDKPVPAGACITITHTPSHWYSTVRSLPGDVTGDGISNVLDVSALVAHLQGTLDPPLADWQCDIDQSGTCNGLDILWLIDLLNGADGGVAWNGVKVPECP